jgi:hypothetical protein
LIMNLNKSVVSKLKCPVKLANEMSGFGFTNSISI